MIATLVHMGHPMEYVLDDYCWEEVQAHYEAALRKDADARYDVAIMFRIAHHGKDKTFKKFLRQLEETGVRIERAMGRTRDSTDSIIAGIERIMGKRRR